jgi:hypothetical protein
MMNHGGCVPRIVLLVIACLASVATVAKATEHPNPDTSRIFDKTTEDKINKTASLGSAEAFERLKEVDFLVAEDRLNKAIHKSFSHRKNEGIEISLAGLSLPGRTYVDGMVVHRTKDLYVGKKIFEAFPEESIPRLLELYERGDSTTRGNVVVFRKTGEQLRFRSGLMIKPFATRKTPRPTDRHCGYATWPIINWCCVSR